MKIILGWLLLSLILSKNFLCVQFGRFYHLRLGKLEQQHGHVDTSFVLAVLKLSRIMPRGVWENATCVKRKSKILLSSKEHTRHALWNLQDNKYSHPFPYLPCTGCHVIHVTWGIEYSRYAQCPVGISIEAFSTGVLIARIETWAQCLYRMARLHVIISLMWSFCLYIHIG